MLKHEESYVWTGRDKLVYALLMVPFLVLFIGAAYLIAQISIYLTLGLLGGYVVIAFIQSVCCVGCPYRGKFCPAIFGIYPGNVLSCVLYPNREHDPQVYDRYATIGQIAVVALFVYAGYWLSTLSWWYVLAEIVLGTVHVAGFYVWLCHKCGYKQTCPAGKSACKLCKSKANVATDM